MLTGNDVTISNAGRYQIAQTCHFGVISGSRFLDDDSTDLENVS